MKYSLPLLLLSICAVGYSQGIDWESLKEKREKDEAVIFDFLLKVIDPANAKKTTFPPWDSSVEYYIGDVVTSNGMAYESLVDNNKESLTSGSWKIMYETEIVIDGANLQPYLDPYRFEIVYKKLMEKFPASVDSSGQLMAGADNIIFTNCKFKFFAFRKLTIRYSLSFINCEIGGLEFNNLRTPTLKISDGKNEYIGIYSSNINQLSIGYLKKPEVMRDERPLLYINRSTINSTTIRQTQENLFIHIQGSKFSGEKNNNPFWVENMITSGLSALTIRNSVFGSKGDSSAFYLKSKVNSIQVDSTVFNSHLDLFSVVEERMHLTNNQFNGMVSFNNVTFPSDIKIRWKQIDGRRIAKLKDDQVFDSQTGTYRLVRYIKPSHDDGISNLDHYEDIMRTYQILYTYYKNAGDIESANGCFSEMKDIQTERLKYLHQEEGTFKSYFRWKLAALMKFYTDHGTDPARALVISVWVILAFAVFYFFFPSDWDLTSKSKLLQNYRDFIEKNDKGYFKPFLAMTVGFIVSLINAITLSINSFTTLGFGNIPTHGIAKYFCVLQGFIGWFLLSIFTVALINQVLG